MHKTPMWARWLAALGVVLVSAVGLAACGSDDSGNDGGGGGDGSAAFEQASAELDKLYKGDTFSEPAVADAPEPKAGSKVWVIDYGLAASAGAEFADATKAAGELMDWDVTVFDGKYNPSLYLSGIREAVAAKADAIVLYAIDCAGVKAGLQAASDADIPVIAAESIDCDNGGGQKMFNAEVGYSQGTFLDWSRAWGEAQATWVIDATDGEAKVINLFETDIVGLVKMNDGFVERMNECDSCEIVETIEFLGTDLGPKLQEKVSQALVQNPDANAVRIPYDAIMTSGVAQAIVASGRAKDLQVIAGEGQKPNVELIRNEQGQDAGIGSDITWTGYHAMDTANRVMNGEKAAESGVGLQVFDREHNLPESGSWEPPIDPVPAYEAAYGAQG